MELLPDLLESVARLRVKVGGTFKGARREVNFTSSDASVTITGTDDSVNERMTVDLVAAASSSFSVERFAAFTNATTSVANTGFTDLDWTGANVAETTGGSSISVSGASIVVATAGLYIVNAMISYAAVTTGSRLGFLVGDDSSLQAVNGTTVPSLTGQAISIAASFAYWLPAATTILATGYQGSAGAVNAGGQINVARLY